MACILVVDDDQDVLKTLRRMLQYAGHVVFGARDGEECEHVLGFARPDVIIMDIFMPKRDGLAAIQTIRQRDAKQRILAISGGHDSSDPLALAQHIGANATLSKPFNKKTLLDAVGELLGGVRGLLTE